MLFTEYTNTVKARRGNMLPLPELEGKTGFRGVYCFAEEVAKEVRKSGSSVGLTEYPVYSDVLVMDFDNGLDDAKKAVAFARERDLSYSLYESGCKGYHVEIPTVPKFGHNVPYSQQILAKRLKVLCDLSLYRHASLYRLPGTVHNKTGKKKELVETFMGDAILDYTLQDAPTLQFNFDGVEDDSSYEILLNRLLLLYKAPPDERISRTQKLFGLACEVKRSGMCATTAYGLLSTLNSSWGDRAKDENTVARVIKEAYK